MNSERHEKRRGQTELRAAIGINVHPVRMMTLITIVGIGIAGCSESSPTGSDGPFTDPANIMIESGDNQEGLAGESLPESLAVRVTGPEGEGLSGVGVRWKITSGDGLVGAPLVSGARPSLGTETLTQTQTSGISRVGLIPVGIGAIAISASAESDSSLAVGFTVEATGVLISIGSRTMGHFFEEGDLIAPDGSSSVAVPVGTPVEWVNNFSSSQGVRSVCPDVCPPGGESFDSGLLETGERFRFVPGVPGTWEYEFVEWDHWWSWDPEDTRPRGTLIAVEAL